MAQHDRALVRNATDAEQLKAAKRKEKLRREQELIDFRTVLGTEWGRRVFWRLLQHCKVFSSIWNANAQIHYDAGKQDVGHFLMAEIAEADDEAIFLMMREAQAAEKRAAAEIDSRDTPSATEKVQTDDNQS